MIRFILKRLLWFCPTLAIVLLVTFVLIRKAPGGPFDSEKPLPPEILKNLENRYGLNRPLHQQFLAYATSLVRGDFGPSLKYKDFSVNEIVYQSLPVSFTLGMIAFCLALLFGIALGVLAAAGSRTWIDYTSMGAALLGISLPSFVIGSLFLWVFAFHLNLFPVAGWGRPIHLVLPAATLSLPYIAYIARLTRASLLEELEKDYVRTAFAKGLGKTGVMAGHVLRNALTPVLSFLGPAGAGLVTGSVVVEKIFAIPGLGTHFVNGAFNRDYTLIMAVVFLYALLLLGFHLIVDVLYVVCDPRIRME